MALVAELERELTRERTTAALRAKRAKGERQGPPPKLDPALRGWIVRDVEAGRSKKSLARDLNERGVPTATGRGRWYPSTTLAVCRSVAYERELTAAAAGAVRCSPMNASTSSGRYLFEGHDRELRDRLDAMFSDAHGGRVLPFDRGPSGPKVVPEGG